MSEQIKVLWPLSVIMAFCVGWLLCSLMTKGVIRACQNLIGSLDEETEIRREILDSLVRTSRANGERT